MPKDGRVGKDIQPPKKDSGLDVSEVGRLKQRKDENKKVVVDLSQDKAILQDVLSKKLVC